MKSTANLKSHPIHPMLVVFPIAFFVGSFVFDILGAFQNASLHTTARYLTIAGLAGGLLAAIPGIIDFLYTVPPKSTGKKRAAKHGLLNTSVMLLFGIALYYRSASDDVNVILLLAIEAIGIVLLFIAGWMGGTLVYRNQIGVDQRYAGAGKWKEETIPVNNGQIIVQKIGDMKVDQMRLIHADGKRIVVARTEDGYRAFSDYCTHRGSSLAGGAMICGTVQCPWHGSQFDVASGAVKAGPAKENIKVYSAEVKEDTLVIRLNA